MKFRNLLLVYALLFLSSAAMAQYGLLPNDGYEKRIREYVDTLRIIDNHEHLLPPEILKESSFFDFMSLFQQYGYDYLVSAGMPPENFNSLFNEPLSPQKKWKIIEPYWKRTFNTSINRVILLGMRHLYGYSYLNENTVGPLSEKIRNAYNTDWFDRILKDSCRIDYIIQDGLYMPGRDDYFRYAQRFDAWLTTRSRYRIDSLAMRQLEPVYSLEDYVKSLRTEFTKQINNDRMVAVKIVVSYSRTLKFDKVTEAAARKVFRSIVNGDEGHSVSSDEAKPLQDYLLYKLLDLAREYKVPVAFHTGLQAGYSNITRYSDPFDMTNLFLEYPDVNFILYHGSYPYGGELSAVAKNFPNVYIDMNWIFSVSPSYSERYLTEWLEVVPASKLIAFGGDMMCAENVFSESLIARNIISDVLCSKVSAGQLTEAEAKSVARMILHDNAARLFNLD